MTPDDRICYTAIVKCLLHFGWNWVGVVTPRDGSGDTEVQELRKMMARHGICIEYVIRFSDDNIMNKGAMTGIRKSTSNIIIVCGVFSEYFLTFFTDLHNEQKVNLTFIFHEPWHYLKHVEDYCHEIVNCSLIFLQPLKTFGPVEEFANQIIFSNSTTDPVREDFWLQLATLLSPDPRKNRLFQGFFNYTGVNDTDLNRFKPYIYELKDSKPVYVYRAVYILANALDSMYLGKAGSFGLKHLVSCIVIVIFMIINLFS